MGTICVLIKNTLARNVRPIPDSFYSTRGIAPTGPWMPALKHQLTAKRNVVGFPFLLLTVQRKECMPAPKSEVLQGTLDLLVLKTLDSMGPMHGFGIALRIQQVSEDLLQLNQGTLYPALLRHEQRGWITSKWGISENNRRAKFYSLTRAGRKHLEEEAESSRPLSTMLNPCFSTT